MSLRIKTNGLLRKADKALSLDDALAWRRGITLTSAVLAAAAETRPEVAGLSNTAAISESRIRSVHNRYGAPGLFRLFYLANSQSKSDYEHFSRLIDEELGAPLADRAAFAGSLLGLLLPGAPDIFSGIVQNGELHCDNAALEPTSDLSRFSLNVLQPSLSRKFYNPGRHEGYVVYGLGGPRILVSHPFRGRAGEMYDVYSNSVDVVTSLIMRGYHGTFLFMDRLSGLDVEIAGIESWLLWFAIIAAHSDLVLFVEDAENGFGKAQQDEIAHTVPRVQKKVVELLPNELRWAKEHEDLEVEFYVTEDGFVSAADFHDRERQHAGPLLESYANLHARQDKLFCMDEAGNIIEYPLDLDLYS